MKDYKYTDLFSGSEVEVLRVKDLLEEKNIPVIIQNDFNSGNLGGFIGGTPSTVRLKVPQQDLEKAKEIVTNHQI